MGLYDVFENTQPPSGDTSKPLYSVSPANGHSAYFVGKDQSGGAYLLVSASGPNLGGHAAIRLEAVEAQFAVRCRVRRGQEPVREGVYSVVRCRAQDSETVRYFYAVCETVIRIMGDAPSEHDVASAVHHLANILREIRNPARETVIGLFGELCVLAFSSSAEDAVAAWRADQSSRYDFARGDARLEVKATSSRLRTHAFSYDQCNPPSGTHALVASLFAECQSGGVTLESVVRTIEERLGGNLELQLKLHEVVASTLGADLAEGVRMPFDLRLAESSLRFFDLRSIPALRDQLPPGVFDVHFRADLT
jgi:hypothetical protein